MRDYGLPVYILEFDVNVRDMPGDKAELLRKQAQVYQQMLEACLESGVCQSFIQFTPGDKDSWLVEEGTGVYPTAFDEYLHPKPAYYAMLASLMSQ